MSDSVIASSVSVTAGDIAKAVYGLTKQQLTAQRDLILDQSKELHDKLVGMSQEWFDDKLAQMKDSTKYVEGMKLFLHLKRAFSLSHKPVISHSIHFFSQENLHSSWLRTIITCDHYAGQTCKVVPRAAAAIDMFLIFNVDESDEGEKGQDDDCEGPISKWVELIAYPLGTLNTQPLFDKILPHIKQYVQLRNEAMKLGRLVAGEPDPTSNMTLEEQVTNTITLKAVENMPGLKDTFDALAISTSLISGYLK